MKIEREIWKIPRMLKQFVREEMKKYAKKIQKIILNITNYNFRSYYRVFQLPFL